MCCTVACEGWTGINISQFAKIPAILELVLGDPFCLHNVCNHAPLRADFTKPPPPLSLVPVTSPCVYVCGERMAGKSEVEKPPTSQHELNKMTSTPHTLGQVTLLITFKTTAPQLCLLWEDMEMNFWLRGGVDD